MKQYLMLSHVAICLGAFILAGNCKTPSFAMLGIMIVMLSIAVHAVAEYMYVGKIRCKP